MSEHADIFALVSEMNVAFNNPKGDPNKINGAKLLSQCKNIGKEFQELMAGFGIKIEIKYGERDTAHKTNLDDIRDALCDINVFSLGAHHFMGLDANIDMHSVIEGVMTRFCQNSDQLARTCTHFNTLGIKYYVEGTFPRVCLKSAEDQGDGEYPKGKFLKCVDYKTAVFYQPGVPKAPEVPTNAADRQGYHGGIGSGERYSTMVPIEAAPPTTMEKANPAEMAHLVQTFEMASKQRAEVKRKQDEWDMHVHNSVRLLKRHLERMGEDKRQEYMSGNWTVLIQATDSEYNVKDPHE